MQSPPPQHPTPSARQLQWQRMELIGFIHFGINTFTNREWGDGSEAPALFNPAQLDARQWAQTARDAGMKMLILTAKHHDGFCLWPSQYTDHSVKHSPWKDGKGDVVRELADACRDVGIKLGIYLSPWDRHEPTYGDSPRYNQYFLNQLRELLSNYGPVGEVWFDGACAEGPNGKKQVYDWAAYYKLIRELQPEAVIAICGPDVRWVGNEDGVARPTEWSVVPLANDIERDPPDWEQYHQIIGFKDGQTLTDQGDHAGQRGGTRPTWYPAECDVSIRPGWFYHPDQDLRVKSVEELIDIYYKSVGRNSVLLLNLTPDTRGLIPEIDRERLLQLRAAIDRSFSDDLTQRARQETSDDGHTITLHFDAPVTFNRAMLQEQIEHGQFVEQYQLQAQHDGQWKPICLGTTIGHKRLEQFGRVTADRVRLIIEKTRDRPRIARVGLFDAPLGG